MTVTYISTASELNDIRNNLDGNFVQTAHIDLTGYGNWTPIMGTVIDEAFTGTYDGQGYQIQNIVVDITDPETSGARFVGLFGNVQNASIRCVHLTNVSIAGNNLPQQPNIQYVGALCGFSRGSDFYGISITSGAVESYRNIGGLIGDAVNCRIRKCFSEASVTSTEAGAEEARAGGLVGRLGSSSYLERCYATGDVIANNDTVGGLIGSFEGGNTVKNSYARGNVSTGGEKVGGFIGRMYSGKAAMCYSMGTITGVGEFVGGFVGLRSLNATELDSVYFDEQTSGIQSESIGKTTAEMGQEDTYFGWDWDITWSMGVDGYPYLHPRVLLIPDPVVAPLDGETGVCIKADPSPHYSSVSGNTSIATIRSGDPFYADFGSIWVKGVSIGNTTINIEIDPNCPYYPINETYDVDIIEDFVTEEFSDIEIVDKNFLHIVTIPSDEVISLDLLKELKGDSSLRLTMPIPSTGSAHIRRGRYLKVEGQYFGFDTMEKTRSLTGETLLIISAIHIVFEDLATPMDADLDRYDDIRGQVSFAVYNPIRDMAVTALKVDNSYYNIENYITYRHGKPKLESIKEAFEVFGGSYFFWKNHIVIVPPEDSPDVSDMSMEYSVNNVSVRKIEKEREVVTELHASAGVIKEGEDEEERIERTVYAPESIREMYRSPKIEYIHFGDITDLTEFEALIDQYMQDKENDRVSYELSIVELKRLSSPPIGDFSIEVGKIVKVKDTDLGIDSYHRVIRYKYKPLEPDRPSTVTLGGKVFDPKPKPYERISTGQTTAKTNRNKEPNLSVHGFVSSEDPDVSRGKENDLWFKY